MEVLVQEVKTETIVPDSEELHNSSHRRITLLNNNNNNNNGSNLIKTSHHHQNHNLINHSTPVRTTTPGGLTMAKSQGLSIVHVTLPQSVIQSPSVIHTTNTAAGLQLSKGNVILVSSKANTGVIQTTGGALPVHVLEASHHQSDESDNDGVDHPHEGRQDKIRREILTRRPSYRKILNDLGGPEITGDKLDSATTSESSQEASDGIVIGGTQYPPGVVKVINTNALGQITTADGHSVPAGLQTITMTNSGTAGGTIVQYAQSQDGSQQFFVPVGQAYTIRPVSSASNSPVSQSVVNQGQGTLMGEEGNVYPPGSTRKREIRLLKNREAARECRRKKKEYVRCLENRVAVLENQNKALIDELKSLKELYCQKQKQE